MYNISKTCQISNLDQIYLKYFGYPSNGYFVEVGAYDGDTFSNTSCLADAGWSGIYIEPVENYYKKCKERHEKNNVKILQYLIGSIETNKTLYVGNEDVIYWGGAITTSNEKHLEIYKNIPNFQGINFTETIVPQIRLDTILLENNISPNFDLLVVDVEGSEYDVYESFDLNFWKPKMMIVEIEENHDSFKNHFEYLEKCAIMRQKFLNIGYVEIHRDATNTIFLIDNNK